MSADKIIYLVYSNSIFGEEDTVIGVFDNLPMAQELVDRLKKDRGYGYKTEWVINEESNC